MARRRYFCLWEQWEPTTMAQTLNQIAIKCSNTSSMGSNKRSKNVDVRNTIFLELPQKMLLGIDWHVSAPLRKNLVEFVFPLLQRPTLSSLHSSFSSLRWKNTSCSFPEKMKRISAKTFIHLFLEEDENNSALFRNGNNFSFSKKQNILLIRSHSQENKRMDYRSYCLRLGTRAARNSWKTDAHVLRFCFENTKRSL